MSVPREDYDLRLRWRDDPHALNSQVLDLLAAPNGEVVALVAWDARFESDFVQAGFSVIRFTKSGAILWQSTHTICDPAGDCGHWLLRYGAITTDDGKHFLVIGTIVDEKKPGVFDAVGFGIDDGGKVAWARRYQTTYSLERAVGIVPLAKAGRFLIAARNHDETETWLHGIDRNGALLKLEMRFFSKFVQRLRRLPTQGIFVLGTSHDDPSHPLGWILNVDPTTEAPAWERTYDPGDDSTLCWYDAAETKENAIVIGNSGAIGKPFVATLASGGDVRAAYRPAAEGVTIFVNGIANGRTPDSTSSICGEYNSAAWHIAIDDALRILWQKKYNHGGSSASLTPIAFTSEDTVAVGGLAIVPGDPLRGLVIQSHVAIGTPAPYACGEETQAAFEPIDLSSATITSKYKDLAINTAAISADQATRIEVDEGCMP